MDGDVVETAEVEPVESSPHHAGSSPRQRPLNPLADDEDGINKGPAQPSVSSDHAVPI